MPVMHEFVAMGSPCQVYLDGVLPQQAQPLLTLAEQTVTQLEAKYSRYQPSSLLSQWHHGTDHKLDDESLGLFAYADACFDQSGGLFDPTSGILRQAWDFKQGTCQPGLIDALRPLIGWQKLVRKGRRLCIPKGMALDFGGLVKEYAADKVASVWQQAGVRHGLINLGGDIRAIGTLATGRPWQVGISDPAKPEQALGHVLLNNESLASSGDYQRRMVVDGIEYSHILNPNTGWPIKGLKAVSVKAPLCMVAGSLATISMLKGEVGASWLAQQTDQYLAVDAQGQMLGELCCNPEGRL